MEQYRQTKHVFMAFKDWVANTPLRIWGWIMGLIAFIAGLILVAIWLQQHTPPWWVWIGFITAVLGVLMISFVPYYKRTITAVELFFDSDKCIWRSPIYYKNAQGEREYTYEDNIIYMVGIKSKNQVENVEVKLVSVKPEITLFGELVLNPRGIPKGSPSTFTINRDDTKYVEVIEWYEPLSEASIHSYENYNVGIRPVETTIPEGIYIFKLQVTGNNIPKCEKQFQVTINRKSGISLRELEA